MSHQTNTTTNMKIRRGQRTDQQIQSDCTNMRVSLTHWRESRLQEERAEVNKKQRLDQRQTHRFIVNTRKANDRQRQQVRRAFTSDTFLRLAFKYKPDIEYYAHSKVTIGAMDKECPHCHALRLKMSQPRCVTR